MSAVVRRVFHRILFQPGMLDFNDGLLIQRGRVTEDVERRIRRGAVEDDIEPVISPKAFCGVVFIGRQRGFADVGPAFHLDETHVNGGL